MSVPLWEGLDAVITNYLRGITLQDVMDGKVQPSQADQA